MFTGAGIDKVSTAFNNPTDANITLIPKVLKHPSSDSTNLMSISI